MTASLPRWTIHTGGIQASSNYLTCLGLLLWNLGTDPSTRWVDGKQVFTLRDLVQSVSTRLGVSIIVVAVLHTVNILVLSILNQKSRPEKSG